MHDSQWEWLEKIYLFCGLVLRGNENEGLGCKKASATGLEGLRNTPLRLGNAALNFM
jgi:hypothetical protein